MKTIATNLRNPKKGVVLRILPIIIRFALGNAVCSLKKKNPKSVTYSPHPADLLKFI